MVYDQEGTCTRGKSKWKPYLLIILRLRLASELFACVIAVDNAFHEVSEIQNLQHPLRVLMVECKRTSFTEPQRIARGARTSVYALVNPQRRLTAGSKSSRSLRVFGSDLIKSSNGRDASHFASKSRASMSRPNKVHVIRITDEDGIGRKYEVPIWWCLTSPRMARPYSL